MPYTGPRSPWCLPWLEISPFTLLRRLREGQDLLLVDVRRQPGDKTLRGAIRLEDEAWTPPDQVEVVVFDNDETEALDVTRRLQQQGFERVRALFGGLELYEFSFDPEVVEADTFLEGSTAGKTQGSRMA